MFWFLALFLVGVPNYEIDDIPATLEVKMIRKSDSAAASVKNSHENHESPDQKPEEDRKTNKVS